MAEPARARRSLSARIDWLFTTFCYVALAAILAALIGIYFDSGPVSFFDQPMGFFSLKSAGFTVYFLFIIATFALMPVVSLIYLISSLFSETSFDQKGILLSSVAVVTSGLAVLIAIDQGVCDKVAGLGGDCLPFKFAFLFDQFSKGGFGDIFDIYDWKLSVISTTDINGLARLYTLNFRMISALYLAMLVVALYRRVMRKDTK